jgi:hypothetical protein
MLVNDRFRPIADISEHRLLNGMPQIGPDNWLEAERLDRRALRARLVGMYAAGPWTTLPAIASLPIMAVAGEGDYIIIVMGGAVGRSADRSNTGPPKRRSWIDPPLMRDMGFFLQRPALTHDVWDRPSHRIRGQLALTFVELPLSPMCGHLRLTQSASVFVALP